MRFVVVGGDWKGVDEDEDGDGGEGGEDVID